MYLQRRYKAKLFKFDLQSQLCTPPSSVLTNFHLKRLPNRQQHSIITTRVTCLLQLGKSVKCGDLKLNHMPIPYLYKESFDFLNTMVLFLFS